MTTCSASAKNSQRSISTPIAALSADSAAMAICSGVRRIEQQQQAPPTSGSRNSSTTDQPAQLLGVAPRHLIAHLAHHEVRLGVRRIERPHRAEMAEAGGGFGGVGFLRRVDRGPIEPLQDRAEHQRQRGRDGGPAQVDSRRSRAAASAARRRSPAPAPHRSARPAAGSRRGWSAATRRSCRCTRP